MSFFDTTFGFTEREKNVLDRSCTKLLSEDAFPYIDKDRFSVLYSSDPALRPDTPINVIVGAETIKMIFDYSDDDGLRFLHYLMGYEPRSN